MKDAYTKRIGSFEYGEIRTDIGYEEDQEEHPLYYVISAYTIIPNKWRNALHKFETQEVIGGHTFASIDTSGIDFKSHRSVDQNKQKLVALINEAHKKLVDQGIILVKQTIRAV